MVEEPLTFKVLILGDMAVGKTCLLIRFCDGKFQEGTLASIGIDFRNKYLMHNGHKIGLELWDTAGQERFRCITKNYFKGTDGIILIYDITKNQSFANVKGWMNNIKESLNLKEVGVVLCGNKCDVDDCDRQVSYEEGQKLADHYKIQFFEISSKQDINVNDTFVALINQMIEIENNSNKTSRKRSSSKLEKSNKKEKKKECSC